LPTSFVDIFESSSGVAARLERAAASGGHGGSQLANTSLDRWLDHYCTAATSRHQVK